MKVNETKEVLELVQKRFRLEGETVLRDGKTLRTKRPNGGGYLRAFIGKVRGRDVLWALHRLKFFLAHGYLPSIVDHKDTNRLNNSLDNLRDASAQESSWNRGRPSGKRKSRLPRGVYKSGSGYSATVTVNGKSTYLGWDRTPEGAAQIWRDAVEDKRGEFFRYRRKR